MYKVTIQETPVKESNWRVVATGTWTPGQPPQLGDQILPAEVVEALFNVTPSATDQSGRNQVQCGEKLYALWYSEDFQGSSLAERLVQSPRESPHYSTPSLTSLVVPRQ